MMELDSAKSNCDGDRSRGQAAGSNCTGTGCVRGNYGVDITHGGLRAALRPEPSLTRMDAAQLL